jgi:hypothetical protein
MWLSQNWLNPPQVATASKKKKKKSKLGAGAAGALAASPIGVAADAAEAKPKNTPAIVRTERIICLPIVHLN